MPLLLAVHCGDRKHCARSRSLIRTPKAGGLSKSMEQRRLHTYTHLYVVRDAQTFM